MKVHSVFVFYNKTPQTVICGVNRSLQASLMSSFDAKQCWKVKKVYLSLMIEGQTLQTLHAHVAICTVLFFDSRWGLAWMFLRGDPS